MTYKVKEYPGLDSCHPGTQYLISSVCQICVVKLNTEKMWRLISTSSRFFSFRG
jgi:hypothetical protein